MTPRVKAWMRQAESDVAVAKLNAEQGFLPRLVITQAKRLKKHLRL